jgi:hypothetical protein
MTTFEKIFFWAGIIETSALLVLWFCVWAFTKGEDEKRPQ